MNPKTRILITGLIIGIILIGGQWVWSNIGQQTGVFSEAKITISTDKTEYRKGETVKITIKNNDVEAIAIFFPYTVEKLKKGYWIKIQHSCECPGVYCDIPGPWVLQPTETYETAWYQTEGVCGDKPKDVQVPAGRYRIGVYYIEDGKVYEGVFRGNKKLSYSNEFTIK